MKISYKTDSGQDMVFDTSESACSQFGFLAGERIANGMCAGTVIGVAPTLYDDDPVLWVHFDGDKGAQFSFIGFLQMGYKKI